MGEQETEMAIRIYREILAEKERLKEMEKDPDADTYPMQIGIWKKMDELKSCVRTKEDANRLMGLHRQMMRDERLKDIGIDRSDI